MFLGHFAVAFAAKEAAPRTSLGMLVGAAQLLDLIWPPLVLAGVEQVRIEPGNTAFTPLAFANYPYSHSLLMSVLWGTLAGVAYWLFTRYGRGAITIGAAVVSHWALDFLTHRPDLPLAPGSGTYAGLGLWNSVAGTLLVESLLFVGGVWLYAAFTRPKDRAGRYGFWSYVIFLSAVYAMNAAGSPPPSPQAVAWVAMSVILLVVWAAWFDRHRTITL